MEPTNSDSNSTRSESPELSREANSETMSDTQTESCPGATAHGEPMDTPGPSSGAKAVETAATSAGASGIDRLLQQQKNEIMFELRRMKMGDRPVTGQGNKEAVEGFFQRLQQDHTQLPPDATEQHRPEAVMVEVNALVDRRPVSTMLQSARFRSSLESALRGAMAHLTPSTFSGARQGGQTTGRRTASTAPVPQGRGEIVQRHSAASVPTPPPLPQGDWLRVDEADVATATPIRAHQLQEIHTQLQARSHGSSTPTPPSSRVSTPPHPTPRTPTTQPQGRGLTVAQQWLTQQPELPRNADLDTQTEYILEQSQREEFIAEISELVQRQLVTSNLSGNFRNQLEHLMDRRLVENMQTNRGQVQQFIRSLPHTNNPRNDFSHLGINGPQGNDSDILDDISVISATAAVTVPNAQNQAMSRELASVKTQLQELRSMMRLSFDLQLDIQRAIRQEVSAAVSTAMAGASSQSRPQSQSTTTGASGNSRPISETQCLICIDHSVDAVLYQCGHMCVCYKCGLDLRSRNAHCPVCRAPIRDIIRAYRCNDE